MPLHKQVLGVVSGGELGATINWKLMRYMTEFKFGAYRCAMFF